MYIKTDYNFNRYAGSYRAKLYSTTFRRFIRWPDYTARGTTIEDAVTNVKRKYNAKGWIKE